MPEIVPFSPVFAPVFYRLNKEWITENFVLEPLDEKVLGDPHTYIITPGGEIWFALHEGKPVGCYALLHHEDGRVEFTKFAVDSACRGLGIGSALLKHAVARAREAGTPELILYTNTKQERACAMYERYGFVKRAMTDADKARYARADLFMALPL